jgi:hypothetical protein
MESLKMPDFINGMIFVCDENTTEDMFKHKVFGLPATYFREMKLLTPKKSALFLFEKQTNLLRGIFVPTCSAQKLLVPDIWMNGDQCSFPSQIRFELHSSFSALPKDSYFAPMFLRRMKVKGKYLDKSRVNSLIVALNRYERAVQGEQLRMLQMSVLSNFASDYSNLFHPQQRNPFSSPNISFLQQENELLRFENEYLKFQNLMNLPTPDGVQQDGYASDDEIDVIDPFKLKELNRFFNQGETLYQNMNAPNKNQYQQPEMVQWQKPLYSH